MTDHVHCPGRCAGARTANLPLAQSTTWISKRYQDPLDWPAPVIATGFPMPRAHA
ncbi:MAG: hypothetical protein Q6365_022950 [Candidatus Sigynarchaeota archaeon]